MNRLRKFSYILLVISSISILYTLIFSIADWIVYGIAIFFIPFFVLSLGLITMSRPKKDEEEERIKEPFIGY